MQRSIIQGGMGVNVSSPFLARACAEHPQVQGTVSGVAVEHILARTLQRGDPGGHYRRALQQFPIPGVAERILKKYFVEGGIPVGKKFKSVPIFILHPGRDLIELTVAGSFAAVWLAKEGHNSPISINYLEKIQLPHLFHIFGAMLAGVDQITMGAGITLQVPSVLDAFANGHEATYRVTVEGSPDGTVPISFNPSEFFNFTLLSTLPEMKRPKFVPIVSTDMLAKLMVKRLPEGSVQGFVVELPTAGGHNAPPRVKGQLNTAGEPVYGPKDAVNFAAIKDLGIPFWIGGSYASPESLAGALALGAEGIQAGSIFALCEESGMSPEMRKEIRRLGYRGELVVHTDPVASPTGFPFKVVRLPQTLSNPEIYANRERLCNICLLRNLFQKNDGTVGFRCPAEPVEVFVEKGGQESETTGVRCLCNGLMSAVELGDSSEPPIFTLGDDVSFLRHLMIDENDSYTAMDAANYILNIQSDQQA